MWGLHVLPVSVGILRVPSTSQRCAQELMACLHSPCLSGCGCEWPCEGRACCPGGSRLVPPVTLSWNKWVENNDLTCFYESSLNMYSSHVFQCLILKVFGVFRSLVMFL